MKKVFAILTASLLAVLLLAACGGKTAPSGSTAPAGDGETYDVFLITMDQMDQHWVTVDEGCQKAVEELGNVNYKWLAPDVKDDAKQIEQINNAVAEGADAILLAANGPDAVTAALEEAEEAGVTIVYVDSPADLPAARTLATDNVAAGKLAGEEMLVALEEKGTDSGSIGIVNVNAATQSTVDREEGFREAFEGTDFEILETQYGEGDAVKSQEIATNYINQGVVGIFGANEGSTVGSGNANKEAGDDIVVVGFDQSDTIQSLIEDGSILCTMAQNPDVMGYEGIKVAVAVLSGSEEADGAIIDTGVSVLDKDTI